jgi:hypothetical protein
MLDLVHAWLGARLEIAAEDGVEQAAAAVTRAIARVREVEIDVAGTWGIFDLEATHDFFARRLLLASRDSVPRRD